MRASSYYKYNLISPESLYAKIKEELKSYFQTGVVDDILFPRYTEDCLRGLSKGTLSIEENILKLEDFEAKLPEDFDSVRELYLVTSSDTNYKLPTACYEQSTIRVTPLRDRCSPGDYCAPEEIKVTYKTTGTLIQTFSCQVLLRPGNVHSKEFCKDSVNMYSDSEHTFDIRGNKIMTNFREGSLFLTYYAKKYDENSYQLIPDNLEIMNYIEAYIKYKCFESIYNNVSDETLNQIAQKLMRYENLMYEAKTIALTEMKKQTIFKQIDATKTARNRFKKFDIR